MTVKRDLRLYFIAILAMGLAGAMVDSSFNNFLKANWDIGGLARSALELPRELPGFLNVFVAAALAFLPGRRIGAVSFALQATGIALLAFFSSSFSLMTLWLFMYSLGQHVFLPLQQSIGMELATEGGEGALLGRANAARNLAQVAGGGFVFIAFGVFHISFDGNFMIVALVLLAGAAALALMSAPPRDRKTSALILKKRYGLFYLLSVLFGTRKQLFLTFAPWVIVSVYGKPTSVMAVLYLLGGLAGVFFQPILGAMVDRRGPRFMLGLEALLLVPVCLFYGFARFVFPDAVAFMVISVAYIMDSVLLSFGMARSIYLKRIAEKPEDIAPTLAMGISIDHVFSISVALISGIIWDRAGYQWVFMAGAGIAVLNFVATRFVRLGDRTEALPVR